jgi:subtilisin family serine protease
MSNLRKPALLLLLLCLLPASSFAYKIERLARVSPLSGKTSFLEVAGGSALVRFKTGASTSTALAPLAPAGFKVLATFERFDWSVVGFPDGISVAAGLQLLAAQPAVAWAEPNRVYKPRRVPNDPFLASQYALAQVQAFGAWEYGTGSPSTATVAFIDTGIDGAHPELSGKLTATSRAFDPGTGAASNNQPPTPACNHATRAAGVAAAASDNSAGVAGMSWGAKLLSLKVFDAADCLDDCGDENFYGSCSTTETSIAAAVNDVIALHNTAAVGKLIINMSLGSSGSCSGPLQTAVNSASAAGLLLFAAAGNESIGFVDSPANCTNVIAVGATDEQDRLASFSNTDTLMITKGLTAPGVGLYTTDINGGYATASGTSFSSPMAAGLAALVWSAKPALSAAQVFDVMKNSADDLGPAGPDRDFGFGRINAMKAMRLALTGTDQFAGTNKAVAYPNPFRPKTQRLVTFTVPREMSASGVQVKVYTIEGELVKKIDGLAWDGKNEAGLAVASGVYLFRVKTDKDAAVGRFALIK